MSLWVPELSCDIMPAKQRALHHAELLVSMGPSPHLWFLLAKQRLLDLNYKSLWVPDITCCFVNEIQRD